MTKINTPANQLLNSTTFLSLLINIEKQKTSTHRPLVSCTVSHILADIRGDHLWVH